MLLAATGPAAADMLPLERGIYVVAGTPCRGASNADTLSYWGGRNGINDQQTGCTISRLTRNGATYALRRHCTSGRFGGSYGDQVRVTVSNRTHFVFDGRAHPRAFRYCGPRVQF